MQKELLSIYRSQLEQKYRQATINKKIKTLEGFFAWCHKQELQPLQIHYIELIDYINHCTKQSITVATVNDYLGTIRNFYSYLHQEGKRKDNPAIDLNLRGGIKRQPLETLSREELDNIYKNFPSGGIINKRSRAMVGLLVYQGITAAELLRLEAKDVKLNEGSIYIPAAMRGNGRVLKLEALQAIHLQNYLLSVRKALLAMRKKPTEKLFFTTGKRGTMASTCHELFKQIQAYQSKVKRLYQLRSSVIAHWLKTHHIRQVQYMAGHRWVSSTANYRTDQLESLQEQLEKLHPLR